MAKKKALDVYLQQLEDIRKAGTWREERVITTPQMSRIDTTQNQDVLNLCANNYLGLSNDSRVIKAARDAYDTWGFGLSSVRFICGTQLIHKRLEQRLAAFLQMDDVILYSSCFDANGGLFETLLGENDAVVVATVRDIAEDPALIRRAVLAGARSTAAEVYEVAGRAEAIHHAVGLARAGDMLVIVGKGDERHQIMAHGIVPHSDPDEVEWALRHRGD